MSLRQEEKKNKAEEMTQIMALNLPNVAKDIKLLIQETEQTRAAKLKPM